MKRKKGENQELDEEVEKLIEQILAEAKKASKQIDTEKLVQQVLTEARIIARWNRKPFYIS